MEHLTIPQGYVSPLAVAAGGAPFGFRAGHAGAHL